MCDSIEQYDFFLNSITNTIVYENNTIWNSKETLRVQESPH